MKYNKFSLFMCIMWLMNMTFYTTACFAAEYDPNNVLIALMSLYLAIYNYRDAKRGE